MRRRALDVATKLPGMSWPVVWYDLPWREVLFLYDEIPRVQAEDSFMWAERFGVVMGGGDAARQITDRWNEAINHDALRPPRESRNPFLKTD